MHCAKASRLIQLYVDQQLSLQELRSLEQHLATCATCREELFIYEEIGRSLECIELVAEPENMTASIMKRVALSTARAQAGRQRRQEVLIAFRPSWRELLAAILLATIAMLGVILSEPSLRGALPVANGHDPLSLLCISLWNDLLSLNSATVMLCFWIVGSVLGIWITLALAGSEMRSTWLRAVMQRLPVW